MSARQKTIVLFAAVAVAGLLGGCRDTYPHSFTIAPGDVQAVHGKPAEGGYYTNWDPYAATLEITPVRDVNPVRTQHVLIATVKDKDGNPLPNRRIEWLIAEGSVGAIVEVDESGWRASRGHKLTNKYAVTHTNNFDHVLTRGTDDPKDDIALTKGQTWCVITSPVEGTSEVIAYAPGIFNWEKHKVFATKHWFDVAWQVPPPATNRVGTDHVLKTKVMKHSDGSPLAEYEVTYKILDGPAGTLDPGSKTAITVLTDKDGVATATIKQAAPKPGTNNIEVMIVRPENKQCCKPAALIHVGKTSKTWLAPAIGIKKMAPATAIVNQQFQYNIQVSNPAKVAANNVVVTDTLPEGIAYVSSNPNATVAGQKLSWSLGTMAPGGSAAISVTVKATKTGTFENCAQVAASDGLKGESCASTRVTKPALSLVKEAPAEVILCDPIPYSITVRNTGDAPATNVRITDELPEGLTMLDGRKSATFEIGTLQPGEGKVGKVTVKAAKAGTYTNTANATADGGLTASASAKTLVRVPALVLTKSGPKTRYVGRPVTYTITVKNTGDAPAKNTVVTDAVPAGTQFVSASNGGKLAGSGVTWQVGTIEPNGSATVTMTVNATRRGTIRNTATAEAYCAKASGETTTQVEGIPAILLECIDLADPIEIGAQETYEIIVTNQGSADGTNIMITCTLPDEQDYVSATGPTKATVAGKTVTFAPLANLAPQAKATYKVVTKGVKAGDTRFKVSLNSDQMTTPAEETESTHIYSAN
ncbi:MAG TPA: DUF11 domain-containing protein [Phycisphaerae bacterium]|nr:DUF11 domain-containing protein [Phycisphaerae bacterium]